MRKPIDSAFNAAVLHCAMRSNPRGWMVSDDAPDTLASLQACIERDGRITVWRGGSDATMFADAEINYAFRAWHDSRHARLNAEFDSAGELETMRAQIADLTALYAGHDRLAIWTRYLEIEIAGQFDFAAAHGGEFPADQYQFTLDSLKT
jgi:hypothetical protein